MLLPMRTLRRQEDPEQQRERLLLNTNAGSSPSVGALESAHSYDSIGDGPGIGRMIILNKTQQQQHQQDPTSNRRKSKQQRPNAIRNQKYSIITFVPLVFYEQFKFFFNLYFLLVALSQLIPQLQIGYIFTYFAPLAFVLLITMVKEALDDFKRYRRDQEVNAQLYQRLSAHSTSGYESVQSADISCGDLIRLEKNQRVPADMVLLRTSERSGSCFLRTDQLDGETDWKLRVAVSQTQHLPSDISLLDYQAVVRYDPPHKDIHSFVGNFHRTGGSSLATSPTNAQNLPPLKSALAEPLTVDNTLWANTVLASGSAIGVVVYTGTDTRAVMNTNHPESKIGLFDLEINRISKILCAFTFLLALTLIALNQFQGLWYIYLMRFLIIFSSIIPISLRVNLDMGKTLYSWQIMHDRQISDTIVRNSSIPEELGRIEYLLTDKTGTLTRNEMELKKLHMGTMCYGEESLQEVWENIQTGYWQQQQHLSRRMNEYISAADTGSTTSSSSSSSSNNGLRNRRQSPPSAKHPRHRDVATRVFQLVEALAVCHNVTPVLDDDNQNATASVSSTADDLTQMTPGAVTYQASSPDEVAIVKWTESAGLMLVHRDMNSITLRLLRNISTTAAARPSPSPSPSSTAQEDSSYPPLRRKPSMPAPASLKTSLAADFEDSPLSGAGSDVAAYMTFDILHVFPFTSESKRMGIIVRDRASGEIVLYMKGADSVMSKIVQFNDWLDEECGNMAREGLRTLVIARKRLSVDEYQEFDSRYRAAKLSLSARTEQMQRVVGELLESNLELLGLTGVEDKLQDEVKTTLEVLRNSGIKIWMLTGDKIETATNIALSSRLISRTQTICHIQRVPSPHTAEEELDRLAVFGSDTCLIIDGQSLQLCFDHYLTRFMETAIMLPAVVCCRCSPTQKQQITTAIKRMTGRRVCAIGDGGNDVSMIQAADVGVGIVGKEGRQASLAADFSVTQFSHLMRLLLWHGRNSYKRSAKLSQFVIHRGLIISIIQAVFSAIFFFAPIALYQGMLLIGYSTVYTMAPVFSLVLDTDVSEQLAMMYPELYRDLIKGRSLSMRTFVQWLLISWYQGAAIMMLAIWLFEDEFIHVVSITFTALIFNELLMVALEITRWHVYMIYAEIITLAIYLASMTVLKTDFDMDFIMSWRFVWKTVLITLISCAPLFIIKKLKQRLAPPSYQKLQ